MKKRGRSGQGHTEITQFRIHFLMLSARWLNKPLYLKFRIHIRVAADPSREDGASFSGWPLRFVPSPARGCIFTSQRRMYGAVGETGSESTILSRLERFLACTFFFSLTCRAKGNILCTLSTHWCLILSFRTHITSTATFQKKHVTVCKLYQKWSATVFRPVYLLKWR